MTMISRKRLFWDTNVLLDVFLRREPFFPAAAKLWLKVENGECEGLVSIPSLVIIEYVARKAVGRRKVFQLLNTIVQLFNVVGSPPQVAALALESGWKDFEDAVQYQIAVSANADYLITRNTRHFPISPSWKPQVVTPETFLSLRSR